MAEGGFDCSFVDSPPDDLTCSICLLVLRDPLLTGCCGNHFCRACVLQVQRESQPCPLCGATAFTTMLDKYFVRKVNELKVECPTKEKGCSWVGDLGRLSDHLDPKKGDCKFLISDCPNLCGRRMYHGELDAHQLKCPRRPYICKFCDYKGVFEDMSKKHWTVCEKYPMVCPNSCGEVDIERRYLERHLRNECTLEKADCEFAHAGCRVRLDRSEVKIHRETCIHEHLALVSAKCLHLSERLPADFQQHLTERLSEKDEQLQSMLKQLEVREQEVVELRTRLATVQEEMEDVKSDCAILKSTVFIPPFEFVMTDYERRKSNNEQWLGPPFYSHIGGYRMCMSLDVNGSDECEGTHVSLYVNLMKGEYDNNLHWPFKGVVVVQLLNQRKDEGTFEEKILFTRDTASVAGRVIHGEVAASGLGISDFISHQQLGYNAVKIIEYLRSDCLRFRVARVDVSSF